jgi:sigma-B regulation protein RsbU (phosphoserine phosphatase)
LTYANAGHSPGYVLDPSGDVRRRMPGTGLPLGIRPNERFVESTDFPLDPGEIVVLLSDGVTEALDPNGNAFGLDRAIGVVHADRNISAAGIVDRLLVAVDAFVGDAPQADDITAVVMKLDRSDAVAADRAVVGAHDNGSASRRRGAGSIGADDK